MKVALPATGSVSFLRAPCVDNDDDDDDEWRSIATESGPVPPEILRLRGTVLDERPTEVMGAPWWLAELPPSQLRGVGHVDVAPRRKTPDARMSLAPLTLLLAALSLAPPALTAAGSPVALHAHVIAQHEAEPAPTNPAAAATGPVVTATPPRPAAHRRAPTHATRHVATSPSNTLVREVPF